MRVHQMDGLRFVADTLEHPPELEFARGIQKHTKSVGCGRGENTERRGQ